MTKEGSAKVVNVMTPGAGVIVLGYGHIRPIVKMQYMYFFFKKVFSTPVHKSDKLGTWYRRPRKVISKL